MSFSRHLQWCSIAALLQCWTLLSFGAQARPFVLLTGLQALPDDDTEPAAQARFDNPMKDVLPIPLPASMPGSGREVQAFARPARDVFRSPIAIADRGLARVGMHEMSHAQPMKCRDVRREVVVESGLQGFADVFSGGRTAFQWALPSATTSGSSPFVLPTEEQVVVFAVRTGLGTSLAWPKLAVSDPSIVKVELAEKDGGNAGADGKPVIIFSKHFCKRAGVVTVAIELPLQANEVTRSSTPLCPGTLAPVTFAYQKACSAPGQTHSMFMKALDSDLPARNHLLAVATVVPTALPVAVPTEKPWAGIIPNGGVRAVVICVLVILALVVAYEFTTHWLSGKIKEAIIEMGPVMFGCQIKIDHVGFRISPRRLTYTLQGMHFANPEGGAYQKPYFMNIEEVQVWIRLWRIIVTCGKVIEIKQLVARHITCNIEKDGIFFGQSNIDQVKTQMEKNNQEWLADLERIKNDHGIDAAKIWDNFEKWAHGVASRVTLQEVFIEGIGYSLSNKAFGMEVAIADMEYHDFSRQHNAVGVPAIGYYLTHAVLEGISQDILGIEFGHGRFEGLVDNIKRLTGKKDETAV